MKRSCQMMILNLRRACGHSVASGRPVPLCDCSVAMLLQYRPSCDFFHYANAELIRAREARN